MLTRLSLKNFRRFSDHELPLKQRTVIVGPNNAGKSTVVEALRLVSLVANRFRNLQYVPIPDWLTDPVGNRGVVPSLRDLNTNLSKVFHQYNDPPAIVEARFSGGESIAIYVGPFENVFAIVHDATGRVVTSKAHAARVDLGRVAVQPQVAPVRLEERVLDEATVRSGLDSALAPSHFRNQLYQLGDTAFASFVGLAEGTWRGLQIRDLVADDGELQLFVRDGSFVGELSTMGHGLQMWLQVVWFLVRNEAASTLVLDEPDVYLHADFQRKLMRVVQEISPQIVVATHSIEIMAEVEPAEILTVNAAVKRSRWVSSLKGVQQVIDNIGGVHNVQLARIASARRCLFVEGEDDVQLLKLMQDAADASAEALDVLPHVSVGGWDGWQRVVGSAQFLKNSAGDVIAPSAIFDSDLHGPDEVVKRYREADPLGIRIHVWLRKEVENYLLKPSCLTRVIGARARRGASPPNESAVTQEMLRLAERLVDDATDTCATHYHRLHRDHSLATANAWARRYVTLRLAEPDGLMSVVPGKKLMEQLSVWSDDLCGATFGASALARGLTIDELDPEVLEVLRSIRERGAVDAVYHEAWRTRSRRLRARRVSKARARKRA